MPVNLDLKIAILKSGQTQRAIALRARMPETRLSAIVRGRLTPTAQEYRRLRKLVGAFDDLVCQR